MTIEQEKLDKKWLTKALQLAEDAAANGEVPVGAVVVEDDIVIGQGSNQPISSCDPTAHAEIIALRQAAQFKKNYRLINTTLYVTLEPCAMCAAAMVHARVSRLVFGTFDPKSGVVESHMQLLDAPFLNHKVHYQGGVMAAECGKILQDFFQARRNKT